MQPINSCKRLYRKTIPKLLVVKGFDHCDYGNTGPQWSVTCRCVQRREALSHIGRYNSTGKSAACWTVLLICPSAKSEQNKNSRSTLSKEQFVTVWIQMSNLYYRSSVGELHVTDSMTLPSNFCHQPKIPLNQRSEKGEKFSSQH